MSTVADTPSGEPPAFLTRWQASGAAERANYQLFLAELCDFLGVPRPNPSVPDVAKNTYVFERDVTFQKDVELIPRDSFKELLKSLRADVGTFPDMVRSLWESMDKGQFHSGLRKKLRRFNGGLFEDCEALPLTADQLELLIEASRSDWKDVEPAIFGTLLERALDPTERHKLGAHYTPRAYVERLVMPTIIEPLRADWDAVKAQANRRDKQDAVASVRSRDTVSRLLSVLYSYKSDTRRM